MITKLCVEDLCLLSGYGKQLDGLDISSLIESSLIVKGVVSPFWQLDDSRADTTATAVLRYGV